MKHEIEYKGEKVIVHRLSGETVLRAEVDGIVVSVKPPGQVSICAWCDPRKVLTGEIQALGCEVSHGICERCSLQLQKGGRVRPSRKQPEHYFEEFVTIPEDGCSPKCLGVRVIEKLPEPGRKLGSDGRRKGILVSDITLQKGMGLKTYKASKSRPIPVYTSIYRLVCVLYITLSAFLAQGQPNGAFHQSKRYISEARRLYSGEKLSHEAENRLADAIYVLEGGSRTRWPYGIKAVYKRTSPRQACINTIRHKHSEWVKSGRNGDFLNYLAGRYCPASGDPIGNRNWKRNIHRILGL